MTIVRVLFPGLWETSWPKYVWFLEMNVYYFKLSTLFIKSTASFKAQLLLCWAWRWGTEGCGVGKETAGISNYYLKHQINIWWLLWDPFLWASGGGEGGCMSLWLYENWECLILAYMYDGGGHDRATDIPTFSIPSPILAHQNPLHMYLFHQGYSVPQKIVFQLVVWANSSHISLIWGHFLLVLINALVRGWLA